MNDYYCISGLEGKAQSAQILIDVLYYSDEDTLRMVSDRVLIHHIAGYDVPLFMFLYKESDASLHVIKLRGDDAEPLPW